MAANELGEGMVVVIEKDSRDEVCIRQ